MGTDLALPPVSIDVREEAKALVTSIAITTLFTIGYTIVLPLALLGAVLGGPIWALVAVVKLWREIVA